MYNLFKQKGVISKFWYFVFKLSTLESISGFIWKRTVFHLHGGLYQGNLINSEIKSRFSEVSPGVLSHLISLIS